MMSIAFDEEPTKKFALFAFDSNEMRFTDYRATQQKAQVCRMPFAHHA